MEDTYADPLTEQERALVKTLDLDVMAESPKLSWYLTRRGSVRAWAVVSNSNRLVDPITGLVYLLTRKLYGLSESQAAASSVKLDIAFCERVLKQSDALTYSSEDPLRRELEMIVGKCVARELEEARA
ncbi:MAG: hypothetical protein GY906_37185 [bacterium]|nr:hypothetical protein [bacterium]